MNIAPAARERRAIPFHTRLAIGFVVLATLSSAIILAVSNINYRQDSRAVFRQRLLDLVTLAALQQDGDAFLTIQSVNDAEFERVNTQNLAIRESSPDITYVYTMRYDEQGLYFVVDAGAPGEEGIAAFQERYPDAGPTLAANYRTLDRPIAEEDFYTDSYGTFLSAYAPIMTQDGRVAGIIAIDFTASHILASERRFLLITLGIYGGLLPIIGIIGWLLGNSLAGPILSLTHVARQVAQGDFSYRASIRTNIPEIRSLDQTFATMASELKGLVENLEARVTSRTADLQDATEQLQARVAQFRTMAQVARTITAIQDMNTLLSRLTFLISRQFNFYHVGIFLLDEKREYASLLASNSEGGLRMLERGHRLKIGGGGIVGNVAATGTARIAQNTGEDTVHFKNPELPNTQSEMALPLRVGREVIGVLDVQSTEVNAVMQEDVAVFTSMADQIAIAIQNARLYQESQRLLSEAQRSSRAQVQDAWEIMQASTPRIGYRITGDLVQRLDEPIDTPEINQAVMNGEIIAVSGSEDTPAALSIPIRLRGDVIGVTNIRMPLIGKWDNDNIDIIQAVTERLSLAIENATLLQSSQRRAARERAISEISAKIGAASEIEAIMQSAVGELRKALGATEVVLTMANDEQGTPKA